MLKFMLPTEQNRADVQAYYTEIEESGGACIGMRDWRDYDRWLGNMRDRHNGTNLPPRFVRENFYLCYDGPALVGVFNLKFELNDFLLNYGGHIGYAVRPSLRRRGYATRMLQQGLEISRQFGLGRVLCVCDDDNEASEKVIRKNGGVLENRIYDPEEKVWIKRYWIDL